MTDLFSNNFGIKGEVKGTRVELVFTDDEYTNLKPGDQGLVNFVDDYGTIHVNWDNGSSLGLIPNYDEWKIVK